MVSTFALKAQNIQWWYLTFDHLTTNIFCTIVCQMVNASVLICMYTLCQKSN